MSTETVSPIPALLLFIPITICTLISIRRAQQQKTQKKQYTGSCHCKRVTFEVTATEHLTVWDCNCSICEMKKNWHFIVPVSEFRLLSGADALTEYRFNTKVAKHMFCKHCGVQAYYVPRSNPDGIAVTFACIPQKQIVSHEIIKYDGQNWESFHEASGISKFSQK